MVWYSHLLKNFPQFIVIHTVKGFGIVNKAEIDVFRYDLNQIPYDYTVEVRNRFKGLDLIEHLMNYGLRLVTLYRRQGSRPSPWKRNVKS